MLGLFFFFITYRGFLDFLLDFGLEIFDLDATWFFRKIQVLGQFEKI